MNETLLEQAQELANKPYPWMMERDTLSDGQEVLLLRHPDLPGCMAQGFTLNEALQNLRDARVDYLYVLLDLGLPVPAPTPTTTSTLSEGAQYLRVNAVTGQLQIGVLTPNPEATAVSQPDKTVKHI
jgi:predicted RNase H-like HicB family nuclease